MDIFTEKVLASVIPGTINIDIRIFLNQDIFFHYLAELQIIELSVERKLLEEYFE